MTAEHTADIDSLTVTDEDLAALIAAATDESALVEHDRRSSALEDVAAGDAAMRHAAGA